MKINLQRGIQVKAPRRILYFLGAFLFSSFRDQKGEENTDYR